MLTCSKPTGKEYFEEDIEGRGKASPLYLTWLKMAEMAKTWLNVDKKWLKWQKNAKMYGEPMLKNQRNIDRV